MWRTPGNRGEKAPPPPPPERPDRPPRVCITCRRWWWERRPSPDFYRDASCAPCRLQSRGPAGDKPPHRTHHAVMDLPGEVEHPHEPFQGLFTFMVMVAKAHPQLVGDGAFLDPAHEEVHLLFLQEARQFQGIGIVHDDGPRVSDLVQFLIIFLSAGLGAH